MVNAIILVSGGLDSIVTAYYIKKKINPKKMIFIFFDYNQRTLKQEEYCSRIHAEKLGAEFKKIDLKWLGKISTALLNKEKIIPETKEKDLGNVKKEQKDILNYWVPCRNSLFLLSALAHAESLFISKKERYDIYIGIKCEGKVAMKDTTPEFIKAINELAEQATHHGGYKISAPLIDKDKDEIVNMGQELNVPFELTYSCYSGSGFKGKIPIHCGICSNCRQRQKGFYWASLKDPSIYKKE